MPPGTLLSSHLHYSPVVLHGLNHPTAFPHDMGDRLFHIHILVGSARQNGHQGMPVVGSRNNNSVEILQFQHPPEILKPLGLPPTKGQPFRESRWKDFTNGGNLHIRLHSEIQQMTLANESDPDETHSNPLIGPHHLSKG